MNRTDWLGITCGPLPKFGKGAGWRGLDRGWSIATEEREEAEREVTARFRMGWRPTTTSCDDSAFALAAIVTEDWDPRRSVSAAPRGWDGRVRATANKRQWRTTAAQVIAQPPGGECVNCGHHQTGDHVFAEVGACYVRLQRLDSGIAS